MKKILLSSLLIFLTHITATAQPTRYGTGTGTGGGTSNAYYGIYAGAVNTGNDNIFIGGYTGFENTTGTNNTFLGYSAGKYNTTGYDNVIIGRYTGFDNTTGYHNVFLGMQSGRENTTGNKNTFVGYRSGYQNVTGAHNTFLGISSGENAIGNSNTFIGSSAGESITTGSNNVYLGRNAGFHSVVGTFNVFLGAYAGFNETASDKLYIESSSATIPLIYGDFSTHQVGINMKPPAEYQFGVTGNMFSTGNLRIDGGIVNSTTQDLQFQTAGLSRITVSNADGNVGIGGNPTAAYKLAVEGHIGAREVNVTNSAWPDYVFSSTYHLPPLKEVEQFINENHHLPEIPSAKEVGKSGINLGAMNAMLLEKIEQLMLYTIAQDKELTEKENRVKALEKRIGQIEKHLSDLNK